MKNYSEDANRQYHIQVAAGEVGRYVILPGDPGRCEKIAQYLDHPVKIAENREFVTYTGELDGEKVSVTSTGIGGPSAAIAMEELYRCGADTFVRIGTCGGIQTEVKSGDIVVATGAVRMEGTSKEYAPIEYPAVADHKVVNALADAAEDMGAALLTESGKIYTGCNIENAAYTPTNCAERTAFFKAVSEGEQHFEAICIVGGKDGKLTDYTPPCGVCRQVMMEFCEPEKFQILLATDHEHYRIYTLKELLPEGFGPARLTK